MCSKYNIHSIIDSDGCVYCRIIKGMYGLKETSMLGRETLKKFLKPFGYYPDIYSPTSDTIPVDKQNFVFA